MVTVHPRERGEHRWRGRSCLRPPGSSPRARGTRDRGRPRSRWRRFIPASAGNTGGTGGGHGVTPVHPRERGEHSPKTPHCGVFFGSSPRARGTLLLAHPRGRYLRFIPASAGNTRPGLPKVVLAPVHPRERGEHIRRSYLRHLPVGSSPRARGTRLQAPLFAGQGRFIPASAGNTASCSILRAWTSVHPRERGEHTAPVYDLTDDDGSSPRARGTHWRMAASRTWSAVHPRERGEHSVHTVQRLHDYGSSPRARGTLRGRCRRHEARRFIPASAGNTPRRALRVRVVEVHPRERGEHATPRPSGSGR